MKFEDWELIDYQVAWDKQKRFLIILLSAKEWSGNSSSMKGLFLRTLACLHVGKIGKEPKLAD